MTAFCLCLSLTIAACAPRADVTGTQPEILQAAEPVDQAADDETGAALDAEPPRRRGFLGFLRKDPAPAATVEVSPDVDVLPPADAPPPAEYLVGDVPDAPPVASLPEPSRRPRPFGFLFKRVPGEVSAPDAEEAAAPTLAALPADTGGAPETDPVPFALDNPSQSTDPVGRFGPGVILPFGQVVTACGLNRRELGTEVDRSPGAGKYRLFDTNPGSTEQRTQFLTGFDDGCARQFTASLALFGTTQVHEATRYNPLNTNPYSDTDDAYERIKTRICRVPRGEFCPEKHAAKLSRNSAFVSVYRGFGDTGKWIEMFLHRGKLVAFQTITP